MKTVPAVRRTDGAEVDFREAMVLERARAERLRREADSLEQFVDDVEAFVEGRISQAATAENVRLRTALDGIALWLVYASGTSALEDGSLERFVDGVA